MPGEDKPPQTADLFGFVVKFTPVEPMEEPRPKETQVPKAKVKKLKIQSFSEWFDKHIRGPGRPQEKERQTPLTSVLRNYSVFLAACTRVRSDPSIEAAPRELRKWGRVDWLTPHQLARLWNIDLEKLVDLVRKSGLTAHVWDGKSLSCASMDYPQANGLKGVVFKSFEIYGFQCWHLERILSKFCDFQALAKFVQDYAGGELLTPKVPARPVEARDKQRAIEYAKRRWKTEEEITIRCMIDHIQKNVPFECPERYADRTIRRWIKEWTPEFMKWYQDSTLPPPEHKGGRPPKMKR